MPCSSMCLYLTVYVHVYIELSSLVYMHACAYMYRCVCFYYTAVNFVVTGSSIRLQWAAPQILDEESIASYVITLSPIQDTANAVTYTLHGSRRTAVLGGLHPEVTYQVQLQTTETSSGLQPFYSANITTVSEGVSESVESGILGAGVMLVIVLVVGGLSVMVCFFVWRMIRRRKDSPVV